jgi:hypothetical protein
MSPAQRGSRRLKIWTNTTSKGGTFPYRLRQHPEARERILYRACRAANDHFAKEYNALSNRIHCVGVLPLKWRRRRRIRRAVTELGLVSFAPFHGTPTALGDPMYDPLYEEAQRLTCRSPSTATAAFGRGQRGRAHFAEALLHIPGRHLPALHQHHFSGVPVRFPSCAWPF